MNKYGYVKNVLLEGDISVKFAKLLKGPVGPFSITSIQQTVGVKGCYFDVGDFSYSV